VTRLPRGVRSLVRPGLNTAERDPSAHDLDTLYADEWQPHVESVAHTLAQALSGLRQAADLDAPGLMAFIQATFSASPTAAALAPTLGFARLWTGLSEGGRRKLLRALENQATPGVSLSSGYLDSNLPPNAQEPYKELKVAFVPPGLTETDEALIRATVSNLPPDGIVTAPEMDVLIVSCRWVGLPLLAFAHIVGPGRAAFRAVAEPGTLFLDSDRWEAYLRDHDPAPDPPRQTDWERVPDAEVVVSAIGSGVLRPSDGLEHGPTRTVFRYTDPDTALERTLVATGLDDLADRVCADSHLPRLRRQLIAVRRETPADVLQCRFETALRDFPEAEERLHGVYQAYFQ
jgi:hypothetical protein